MTPQRVPLRTAERIARELVDRFAPVCERIDVAGSIRRRRADVKDIEIVAIPHWADRPRAGAQIPFGGSAPVERVNLLADLCTATEALEPIKPGTPLRVSWHIDPAGRYWRFWLPGPALKLDVFLAAPTNYGLILMIRTGPGIGPSGSARDGFGPAMLARWKQVTGGGQSRGGMLHQASGQPVATPEEADVFRLCQVRYVEPQARQAAADVWRNVLGEAAPAWAQW